MNKISAILFMLFLAIQAYARAIEVLPSEEYLKSRLSAQKIKTGYDKGRQRLVFIGSMSENVADPASDSGFQTLRRRAYRVAEFKARHSLMDYVEKDVSASECVSGYLQGGSAGVRTESRFTTVSSMELIACVPICSAESFFDGKYSVSVAVGWSEKTEKLAREALKRKNYGDTGQEELEEWLKKFDFSNVLGSRQFIDKNGALYQVGIAASNVEGAKGIGLKTAMRKADLWAVRELAYSLCVPMRGLKTLSTIYERSSTSKHDVDSIATDFTTTMESEISGMRLPGVFRVYDTTIKHPISGQKMYVSVYGLMINDQVVKDTDRKEI